MTTGQVTYEIPFDSKWAEIGDANAYDSVHHRYLVTLVGPEQGNNSTLFVFDMVNKSISHKVVVNDSVECMVYDPKHGKIYWLI